MSSRNPETNIAMSINSTRSILKAVMRKIP
jgi:hypothetical protein